MSTSNILHLKDERTGITYAMSFSGNEHKDYAFKKLKEKMDYDYFESLPAKNRIEKKVKKLDFTCPTCMEKTEVSSRKEKMVSGFLFFVNTYLVDIYKCHKCDSEFNADELFSKKEKVRRENNVVTNFENWKEAKKEGKNPPEFSSLSKPDEIVISSFNAL